MDENGPFIDDFPIKPTIYSGFSMLNNQMVTFKDGYTQPMIAGYKLYVGNWRHSIIIAGYRLIFNDNRWLLMTIDPAWWYVIDNTLWLCWPSWWPSWCRHDGYYGLVWWFLLIIVMLDSDDFTHRNLFSFDADTWHMCIHVPITSTTHIVSQQKDKYQYQWIILTMNWNIQPVESHRNFNSWINME